MVVLGFGLVYLAHFFVALETRRGSSRVTEAVDRLINLIERKDEPSP